MFEKKPIALLAAKALKQIPGTVTLGKYLSYQEIKRTAVMWLSMEMIRIRENPFHINMKMSRTKNGGY